MDIIDRNVVLLAVAAFSGKHNTKETLQGRLYFLGELLERDFGHVSHFYGPYSEGIDADITALKAAGLLRERAIKHLDTGDPLDASEARYDLTEDGMSGAVWLRQALSDAALKIEAAAATVAAADVKGLTAIELSSAAKSYQTIKEAGYLLTSASVQNTLRQFPWSLDQQQSQRVLCYLECLKLVADLRPTAEAPAAFFPQNQNSLEPAGEVTGGRKRPGKASTAVRSPQAAVESSQLNLIT